MNRINLKNDNAGFTLLEALVAISILMVAVAAPITIAQKGLSSASYSKNQMIASYLAQDALEYVKNQRDQASINSVDASGNHSFDWGQFLTDFSVCTQIDGCDLDTITGGKSAYSSQSPLKEDDNHFYGHSGQSTNFTRQVQIIQQYNGDDNEALVTVTVSWSAADSVTVKALIFNY